jgi:mono/diheme cytochrome c family protein
MRDLVSVIQNGTPGNMPAWRGKLSIDDTKAVIAWFQSLWPLEIYAAWDRMDRAAR